MCGPNNEPVATIGEHDSVIFFNLDQIEQGQITRSLVDDNFDGFETKKLNLFFVCFTQYDETMPNVHVAFKPTRLKNTFGEYISKHGLKQLRIAGNRKICTCYILL